MIKTVQIRVSAGHPDMPLEPSAVIQGSAATIGVLDVPRRRCGVDITSVAVTIGKPDGNASTMPATLVAGVWCATFPAVNFYAPGFVANGLTVTAGGKDETDEPQSWILGRGDFEVLSADAVPQPGESWQNVHYRATVPEDPVVGDLARVDGAWKLYTASGWQTLGGGSGGTGDYNELENKPSINQVELTGDRSSADLGLQDSLNEAQIAVLDGGPYLGATGSQRIESEGDGASLTIDGDSSNGGVIYIRGGGYNGAFLSVEDGVSTPASIKKGGKEVATEEHVESVKTELNARIDLIEATSRPNMNIVGSPTFREGNVSGFSANDYLVFPTAVSVGQNTVEFHMAFHTGSDVNTQQNIMDSWCGLAFAIRNGTTVTAISTNGTSFLAESVGGTIRANNSYRMKMLFSYEDGQYRTRIYLADGAGDFVEVGTGFTADAPVYATATYWGGANPGHATHAFGGIINLNECRMLVNGVEVWRGYDELPTVKFDPTATPRLDTAEKIVAQTKPLAQYPIKPVVNGQLLDRTVNTSTGGAFTFPASGTGARDFVVVVAASATAPSVSFPSSGVTYFSDDDAVWTAEADKMNIWYFTEIGENQFMVAHKALAATTQA